MNAELSDLHANLRSDKVTARKNALKELGSLLQSRDFVKHLDRATLQLDTAGGRGDVKSTWAGVCGRACMLHILPHVIQRIFSPRFLSLMATYDMATRHLPGPRLRQRHAGRQR
jgi:hypothetical protein